MSKPIHAKPSFYAYSFEPLKAIALEYGYNLVLHGSLNRDMDLIAIPWQEVIGDSTEMVNKMCEFMGGSILEETDEDRKKLRQKYHGRVCWVINLNRTIKYKYGGMVTEVIKHEDPQYYLDISILPTL